MAQKHPITFTINLFQLSFAIGLQIIGVALAMGSLFNRVEAMEATIEPLSRGELARMDERVKAMQADIAWMRSQMERERDR